MKVLTIGDSLGQTFWADLLGGTTECQYLRVFSPGLVGLIKKGSTVSCPRVGVVPKSCCRSVGAEFGEWTACPLHLIPLFTAWNPPPDPWLLPVLMNSELLRFSLSREVNSSLLPGWERVLGVYITPHKDF